jgi:hypothetical protein
MNSDLLIHYNIHYRNAMKYFKNTIDILMDKILNNEIQINEPIDPNTNITFPMLCCKLYAWKYAESKLHNTNYDDFNTLNIPERKRKTFLQNCVRKLYGGKYCSYTYHELKVILIRICTDCDVNIEQIDTHGWTLVHYLIANQIVEPLYFLINKNPIRRLVDCNLNFDIFNMEYLDMDFTIVTDTNIIKTYEQQSESKSESEPNNFYKKVYNGITDDKYNLYDLIKLNSIYDIEDIDKLNIYNKLNYFVINKKSSGIGNDIISMLRQKGMEIFWSMCCNKDGILNNIILQNTDIIPTTGIGSIEFAKEMLLDLYGRPSPEQHEYVSKAKIEIGKQLCNKESGFYFMMLNDKWELMWEIASLVGSYLTCDQYYDDTMPLLMILATNVAITTISSDKNCNINNAYFFLNKLEYSIQTYVNKTNINEQHSQSYLNWSSCLMSQIKVKYNEHKVYIIKLFELFCKKNQYLNVQNKYHKTILQILFNLHYTELIPIYLKYIDTNHIDIPLIYEIFRYGFILNDDVLNIIQMLNTDIYDIKKVCYFRRYKSSYDIDVDRINHINDFKLLNIHNVSCNDINLIYIFYSKIFAYHELIDLKFNIVKFTELIIDKFSLNIFVKYYDQSPSLIELMLSSIVFMKRMIEFVSTNDIDKLFAFNNNLLNMLLTDEIYKNENIISDIEIILIQLLDRNSQVYTNIIIKTIQEIIDTPIYKMNRIDLNILVKYTEMLCSLFDTDNKKIELVKSLIKTKRTYTYDTSSKSTDYDSIALLMDVLPGFDENDETQYNNIDILEVLTCDEIQHSNESECLLYNHPYIQHIFYTHNNINDENFIKKFVKNNDEQFDVMFYVFGQYIDAGNYIYTLFTNTEYGLNDMIEYCSEYNVFEIVIESVYEYIIINKNQHENIMFNIANYCKSLGHDNVTPVNGFGSLLYILLHKYEQYYEYEDNKSTGSKIFKEYVIKNIMDVKETIIDSKLLFNKYKKNTTYLDAIIDYFCDDDDFYYIIPIDNIINNCLDLFSILCDKSVNRLLLLYFRKNTPLYYIDKLIEIPEFIDIYIKTENYGYDTSLIFTQKFMHPITYCTANNINIIEIILSKCSKYCESLPEKYITDLFKLCNNVVGIYEFECPNGKYKMSMLSIITTWWLNTGKFNIRQYYDICRNVKNLFKILNNEDFNTDQFMPHPKPISYFDFLYRMKQWKALFCAMEYLSMSNEIKIFNKYMPEYYIPESIIIDEIEYKDNNFEDESIKSDTIYTDNDIYGKYKILSLLNAKYMDLESNYEIKLKSKSINNYLINEEFNKHFVPLLQLANIKIPFDLINILCNKIPKIVVIDDELYEGVYERYDEINTRIHFILCNKIDKHFIENIIVNKLPLHYYIYSNIQLWMLLLLKNFTISYIFETFKPIDNKKIIYKTKFKNKSITDYISNNEDIEIISKYIDGFSDWLEEIDFKTTKQLICIICQDNINVSECTKCNKIFNWLDTWSNNLCGNCDDTLSDGYEHELLFCFSCGHKGNGVYHKGCLKSWIQTLKDRRKREKAQLCVVCNENMIVNGTDKERTVFNEVFWDRPIQNSATTHTNRSVAQYRSDYYNSDEEYDSDSSRRSSDSWQYSHSYNYNNNTTTRTDLIRNITTTTNLQNNSNTIPAPRPAYNDTLLPDIRNYRPNQG